MNHHANAIRFEVLLNGQRVCTAGVPQYGVLATGVDWVIRHPESKPRDYTPEQWSGQRLRLNVGGVHLTGPKDKDAHHIGWAYKDLQLGDEVTIRILGPGQFDEPLPPREDE